MKDGCPVVFRKAEMKISIFRLQNPFISGGPENPEKVNFRDSGGPHNLPDWALDWAWVWCLRIWISAAKNCQSRTGVPLLRRPPPLENRANRPLPLARGLQTMPNAHPPLPLIRLL